MVEFAFAARKILSAPFAFLNDCPLMRSMISPTFIPALSLAPPFTTAVTCTSPLLVFAKMFSSVTRLDATDTATLFITIA